MISDFNPLGAYYAMLGDGGEAKFDQVSGDLDKQLKEVEEKLLNDAKKTPSELEPVDQLCLLIDTCLDKSRRAQEARNRDYITQEQFREYARGAYGVNV